MIRGKVADNLDASIELTVCVSDGREEKVSAVIDTGFSSEIAAPVVWLEHVGAIEVAPTDVRLADDTLLEVPCYSLTVLWHGQKRLVRAIGAGDEILIGMRLLYASRVIMDVQENGDIEVLPLQ